MRSGFKEVFLANLLEFLSAHVVSFVQFVSGFFVRVTFESLEFHQAVFHDGIVIDGVEIPVMEADSTVRFVHLRHCPFEVPNKIVAGARSAFGTVFDVQFSCFAGSTVRNGSRGSTRRFQQSCSFCVILFVFGIVVKFKIVISVVIPSTVPEMLRWGKVNKSILGFRSSSSGTTINSICSYCLKNVLFIQ